MRDLILSDSVDRSDADPLLHEAFEEDLAAGRVIGSRTRDGRGRLGADVERRISIDHGALRFQPLITPGWARQGVAYGPFDREPGLALAVSVTNGHNTSQGSAMPDDFARRIWRWLRGPNVDPVGRRLRALAFGPRKKGLARRFAWWLRTTQTFYGLPEMNENLAVGWFGSAAPANPTMDGCGFVVHAALGDNGELWARVGDVCLPAFRGLKNVRLYYVVVLRARGAVYYAAAGPDASALPEFPLMRPVAIDPFDVQPTLYAGIHQCALGQIGFRVDTRVHGVRIARTPELAEAGSAFAADPLTIDEAHGFPGWRPLAGKLRRTARGAEAEDGGEATAVLDRTLEAGLVHALFETSAVPDGAALLWRFHDADNHLALELDGSGARLVLCTAGERRVLRSDAEARLPREGLTSIQVLDAYGQIGCYLNGAQILGGWTDLAADPKPAAAGFRIVGPGVAVRDFEVHPRTVEAPRQLRLAEPWRRFGTDVVFSDRFLGEGSPVEGRAPDIGRVRWRRLLGSGGLDVTHDGARVRASVAAPHAGRTLHGLEWPVRGFADLETEMVPPGQSRGQNENCRSGLVVWQDADNYLTCSAWLADDYEGASISLFVKRRGFEELYDAIWTMVGDAVSWGRPFRLRLICDGDRFVIFVNGEAVMERSLSDLYPEDPPLAVEAVGVATNWEWGEDTGSLFRSFVARA